MRNRAHRSITAVANRTTALWRRITGEDPSLRYLVRWIVIAVVAGAVGSSIVAGFTSGIAAAQELLSRTGLPIPLLAVCGAIVAGAVVYRIEPEAAGEGMPSYTVGLNRDEGDYSLSATLMKLPAGFVTLATMGSGGFAGPVGRTSAGILSRVFRRSEQRTAAICGMAAAIGALLHSPVGGGIFAVEIVQRANMRYRDLFPSVLSSAVAVWISRYAGWEPVITVSANTDVVPLSATGLLLLLSVAVGIVGGLFTSLYALTVRVFKRDQGNVLVKVIIGTLLASTLVAVLNPALAGAAGAVQESVLSGDGAALRGVLPAATPLVLAVTAALLIRAVATCLTIGSGMSAGLLGPSILVGLLAGRAWIELFGVAFGSSTYFACLSVGFAGLLASSMNVPVAAAVMALELFGAACGLPAGLAVVIGFQINRHRTIYDFALAGSGHGEAEPVEGEA